MAGQLQAKAEPPIAVMVLIVNELGYLPHAQDAVNVLYASRKMDGMSNSPAGPGVGVGMMLRHHKARILQEQRPPSGHAGTRRPLSRREVGAVWGAY